MFTGIVEEFGTVIRMERAGDDPRSARLTIEAKRVLSDASPGDSIAVDGCCLTVSLLEPADDPKHWTADVMATTLGLTTLGRLRPGDRVNLERAVRADQRMGGHLVQGHVDGIGVVRSRRSTEHWDLVDIELPGTRAGGGLARYLVDKGSITVDGVSLTVAELRDGPEGTEFVVSLIPETLARTTLGFRQVGEPVNVEVDVVGKYVERLLATRPDALGAGRG
ncbi:MAG: riboflavin synthase [Nocardioides sp.]